MSGQKRRLSVCTTQEEQSVRRRCSRTTEIRDGQNEMHIVCQNRNAPLHEVRILIKSHRELLEKRDVFGRLVSQSGCVLVPLFGTQSIQYLADHSTNDVPPPVAKPLFYALKRACSFEVVTTLFDAHPEAITAKDFCGDSPLYLLYHSSKDYRILQHVLCRNPTLAMYKEDVCFGQTLVKAICAPWTSKQIRVSWAAMESNAILKDRWTKLVLTVRAAHHCTAGVGNSLDTPELHLALEFPCPNLVIRHFLEMYPNQASIIMSNFGCYPLHYFLLHSASLHEGNAVIKSLLKAFPDVTAKRHNGKLPIHLGLMAGLTWKTGISDIIFTNSRVIGETDSNDCLLPFMQAAIYGRRDLTTIFLLLRENPAVLGNLL